MAALKAPLQNFVKEVHWLASEFRVATSPKSISTKQRELVCEMIVVRLYDSWARFCREIVIRSACGHLITTGGRLVPPAPGITDRSTVIPTLMSKYSKKRNEPRWANAKECLDAAERLQIGNLSTIAAAVGAVNSPAEELRRIRNFYAHRGLETVQEATKSGLFLHRSHPFASELSQYTRGGLTQLEAWVADFILIAHAAVQ